MEILPNIDAEFVRLLSFTAKKLGPEAYETLHKAIEFGFITVSELKKIIPEEFFSNGKAKTFKDFGDRLEILGIKVVTDRLKNYFEERDSETEEDEKDDTDSRDLAEEDGNSNSYQENHTSLSLFFRDMGKFALLTAQEEKGLSRVIINEATPAIMRIDAINKLILHNLRLVVHVAKRNRFKAEQLGSTMDLSDLIGEGVLGLRRAAELYDYRFNFRFSTYAIWWVRQTISRAISEKARIVRLPVHQEESFRKIMVAIGQFIQLVGREPEPHEIAKDLKVSEGIVRHRLRMMWETTGYWGKVVKLDGPIYDDKTELYETVVSKNFLHPESAAIARNELEFAEKRLAKILALARKILSDRDFEIFRMRYGIDDNSFRKKTLEEIAEKYSITRERIRQIVDRNCWFRLNRAGLRIGEEWFKKEINRMQLLENLAGRRIFHAKSP